jgi:hypothetical protein
MIFGINIPNTDFESLREVADQEGYKSTEQYVVHLIRLDIAKHELSKTGLAPKAEMTIKLKKDA